MEDFESYYEAFHAFAQSDPRCPRVIAEALPQILATPKSKENTDEFGSEEEEEEEEELCPMPNPDKRQDRGLNEEVLMLHQGGPEEEVVAELMENCNSHDEEVLMTDYLNTELLEEARRQNWQEDYHELQCDEQTFKVIIHSSTSNQCSSFLLINSLVTGS